jgi:hypothetical protein
LYIDRAALQIDELFRESKTETKTAELWCRRAISLLEVLNSECRFSISIPMSIRHLKFERQIKF